VSLVVTMSVQCLAVLIGPAFSGMCLL